MPHAQGRGSYGRASSEPHFITGFYIPWTPFFRFGQRLYYSALATVGVVEDGTEQLDQHQRPTPVAVARRICQIPVPVSIFARVVETGRLAMPKPSRDK